MRIAHHVRSECDAIIHIVGAITYIQCPGGAVRFEKLPTAKQPHGAEAVNAKIKGQSTSFGAKKGGGQLQSKDIIGALAYNLCLYSLFFLLDTWHSLYRKLFRRLWVTFVDNFVMGMFDFGDCGL